LNRNLQLHPRHFGANLRNTLIQKLHTEVEGTCSGRYGFIIMVPLSLLFPQERACVWAHSHAGSLVVSLLVLAGDFDSDGRPG
jgi:hypothetical protein